jgi:hypothetical protein
VQSGHQDLLFWRPCNFTPTHSLTGPVGQPFASRHGGHQCASQGCTQTHNGNGFLLLAMARYIGDPDVIYHWPHPRLRADNGKLHLALRRRCEKPAVITHYLPRFHSTPCRSSSSLQHSDRLEPRSSCWRGALWRPSNFTPTHSLPGPVGQLFASRHREQHFASRGCTDTQNGTGFLLLAMSGYNINKQPREISIK